MREHPEDAVPDVAFGRIVAGELTPPKDRHRKIHHTQECVDDFTDGQLNGIVGPPEPQMVAM
jgi:hypothetical protein